MPDEPAAWPVLLAAAEATGWEVLRLTAQTLDDFAVRWQRAETGPDPAESGQPGTQRWRAVIVASPDGVLPGWYAKATAGPTIRVPVEGGGRKGLDLLRDDAGQLPAGPEGGGFATMAIGAAGAKNAALFLVAAFARTDEELRGKWQAFREKQTADVQEAEALQMKEEG